MKALAILFGVLLALLPGGAQAARLALVIGINAYQNIPRLEKAVGDAEAMATRLETLGFDVEPVIDPDRRELNLAITKFRKSLGPGDVALVHFSGHGVEVDGNNLLLPADVPMPTEGDSDFLRNEAIDLSDLMQRIADSGASTQIFVIDACRDNPFARSGTRGIGGTRGLVVIPAQKGSFVLYSAGRGQTALDTLGPGDSVPTSVYTRMLVETLGQPGISLNALAKVVRSRVSALAGEVGHQQQPAYSDELDGDFFFTEAGAAQPAPTPAPSPANTDAQDFAAAQAIDTIDAWRAFLQYHPTGYYADLAKTALGKSGADAPDQAYKDAGPANDAGVISTAEIVSFIAYVSSYAPTRNVREFVETHYAESVHYYGKPASRADIVADKARWYGRWARWNIELLGTPSLVRREDGAYDLVYEISYEWVGRAGTADAGKVLKGKAIAKDVVVKVDDRILILSESSERS